MSVTSAIRRLVAGGLSMDQAVFAAGICEEEMSSKDEVAEKRRAWDRERKRKLRGERKSGGTGGKSGGNVVSFSGGTSADTVLPEVSLNNNNKTFPNPSPRISPPSPSRHRMPSQIHMFDPDSMKLLGEGWNELAAVNPELVEIDEIRPGSQVEKNIKLSLPIIVSGGMDAPTAIASFMAKIGASDWLMGRKGSFLADFAWVVEPDHAELIVKGKRYENREIPQGKSRGQSGYGSNYGRELSTSGKRVSEAWRGPVRD